MKKIVIFLLGLITFITAIGDTIVSANTITMEKFENVSIEDGLSSVYVNTIFQGSKGEIWIGTSDGLNRYDGNNIKVYNHEIENENSLSATWISSIAEDDYGNLWIGTDGGLDILEAATDKIVRVKSNTTDKKALSHFNITAILKDSNGDMWIGTEKGLNKYNSKNKEFEKFFSYGDNSLTDDYITALAEGQNGQIWIATKAGLNVLDIESNKIFSEDEVKENRIYIYDIEKDKEGNMWIATKKGVFKYDFIKGKLENIPININEYTNTIVKSILCDGNGNVWLSGASGAIKYSSIDNSIKTYSVNVGEKKSIASNTVYCYFEDKNGEIWIGTNNGVSILNTVQQFGLITANPYKKEKEKLLSGGNITTIFEDNDGDIWVGTSDSGVDLLINGKSEKINFYYDENNGNSLSSNSIKAISEFEKGKILIATEKGLNIIYKESQKVKVYDIDENYITEINDIHNSDDEIIWFGTERGLYSYNMATREFKNYNDLFIKKGIFDLNISVIYGDLYDDNILWLGGGIYSGLIKFHKTEGIIKNYTNNINDRNSLSYDSINCIEGDSEGNLWIGTNVGLNKFNIEAETFINYTIEDGLPNNYIHGLALEENNDIWISTNYGLSKFDLEKKKFINYTEMDGVQGDKFNPNSSLKTSTGHIFFGGTNGITYFHPEEISEIKFNNNNVVIDRILVHDKNFNYNGKELVLDYNDNSIAFEFFLPNYKNLNSTTYSYKLEGIDSNWIYSDNRSFANYTLLSPGKYVFKVIARDSNGRVSEETNINIRIKTPFWETPIAYIIYVFLVGGIICLAYNQVKILKAIVKKQTKEINYQMEENKKLYDKSIENEKFKNAYFVNLSHELRTPINVILSTVQLISFLTKENTLSKEKYLYYMGIIKKSSNNLLKIINDIIDSSKIESGTYKINKQKNVDIVYLVEEIALTMSEYIEEKGVNLIIDPEIEEKNIECDPTEIERCIINLLGNASKFTESGGEIRVFIKDNDKTVDIIVEDTGSGISKEDQEFIFNRFVQGQSADSTKVSSSGIGLTLVKYLIDLHKGSIKLESEINKGSRFTITLPVS